MNTTPYRKSLNGRRKVSPREWERQNRPAPTNQYFIGRDGCMYRTEMERVRADRAYAEMIGDFAHEH